MNNKNGYQIDYKKILMTTLQVLQFYHLQKIPIDPFAIIDQVPNLEKYRYSDLSYRSLIPIHEISNIFGSEFGFYAHHKVKNKHIIYYNDRTENLGLLRFTVAHEIAHFFLLHSKKSNENIPYEFLEREANFFARNLLAPTFLVNRLLDDYQLSSKNINLIVNCFQISYEAAKIRLRSCERDNKIMESLSQYSNFLNGFFIYNPIEHKIV